MLIKIERHARTLQVPFIPWRGYLYAAADKYIRFGKPGRFCDRIRILDLHFSRYAGCSCGCSPGYVGKIIGAPGYAGNLRRSRVFMEVAATEEELNKVRAVMNQAAAALPDEIIRGNAKVAAQREADAKARAEQKVKDKQEEAEHKARWAQWDAEAKAQRESDALNSASL